MGVDRQILLWINQDWAQPWLDTLFAWVSERGAFSIPLLLAILAGLAAWRGRDGVKLWGLLILAVLLGDGIGNLLKHLIEQPRPCFEVWELLRPPGGGAPRQCNAPVTGMPSNHALNFFAAAVFLALTVRARWLTVAMAVIAVLVAVSRVYLGKHYPSQVLAGAGIGLAWGALAAGLALRFLPFARRLRPQAPPAGNGTATRFEPVDLPPMAAPAGGGTPAWAARLAARPDWQLLLGLGLALVALRALLAAAAGLEMHFDEAQYWEWSRHLDWSYYSKGPLVAWLIFASESLFGHGEWQTRLPAWIAASGWLALLFALARDLGGGRAAGWWAVLLGLTTPLYFTLGLVMTTDVFLFMFWTWGLWAAVRALEGGRSRAWLELGAAVGLGALTKLSIGLLPAIVGLLVLLSPARWRHLRDPRLWDGLALMVVLMSPVLVWNAANDWVMLRHELGHVGPDTWSLGRLGEFVGGQWLALSPLVAALAVTVLWRRPAGAARRLVWIVSLAGLAFFLFKAATGKVQLNWAAPVYIGFLALFAGAIPGLGRGARRVLAGGMALSVAIVGLALFPMVLGLPADRAPLHRLREWSDPVARLAAQAPAARFALVDDYKMGAWIAYYWPREIPVYQTGDRDRRYNQRDLWPGPQREAGRTGLYVSDDPELPAVVEAAFARCSALPVVPAVDADGRVIRLLRGYLCEDFRPVDWPEPGKY